MLAELQRLPRQAELLAFEAGYEDSGARGRGGRVGRAAGCTCILMLGATTFSSASAS